jgi:hypothetical protein
MLGSLTHSSLGMSTMYMVDDSFGEVEFDLKSIPSPSFISNMNRYRYRISSCLNQQRKKQTAGLVLEKNIPLKLLRFYKLYRFHEYNRQEPFNYNLKPFLKPFFAF